jgi:hypothetical protein
MITASNKNSFIRTLSSLVSASDVFIDTTSDEVFGDTFVTLFAVRGHSSMITTGMSMTDWFSFRRRGACDRIVIDALEKSDEDA